MASCKAFLDYFDRLFKESGIEEMPIDVKEFYDILKTGEDTPVEKPLFTDSGLNILEYLQDNIGRPLKAKDIAEGMNISSRCVSGAIRKLVTDGYVEKFGKSPVIYNLTEKGKNINISNYKGENDNEKDS